MLVLKKRLKEHIYISNKKTVPTYFHRALKKYGDENFVQEILLYCSLSDLDIYEKQAISLYSSNNPKFGYNIATGGAGESKIPKESQYIYDIFRENKLVGYRVHIKINKKLFQKYFTSTKYTIEQNFDSAKHFLDTIKSDEIYDNNLFNRTTKLPKNIVYYIDKRTKDTYGYTVQIIKDTKLHKRTFCKLDLTMEQKFKFALEYKKQLEEELGI